MSDGHLAEESSVFVVVEIHNAPVYLMELGLRSDGPDMKVSAGITHMFPGS